MIDDLVIFINKLQANNHDVILTIASNEPFEYCKGGIENLIPMTDLVDPIVCTNGLQDIPNTNQ